MERALVLESCKERCRVVDIFLFRWPDKFIALDKEPQTFSCCQLTMRKVLQCLRGYYLMLLLHLLPVIVIS